MTEPINLKGTVEDNYLAEGKCCICGQNWTKKNCINIKNNYIDRYLDGAPKENVLQYIEYPIFCTNCKNASSFESPVTDAFGTRDKYNENTYQEILNSDEPEVIKLWKLAEYRDRGYINYYHIYTKVFLWLYWYYDSINNIELREYYADKIIDAIENCNGTFGMKIITEERKGIILKKYMLDENLLLTELYRRKGDFKKALYYIENKEKQFGYPDKKSSLQEIICKQKELCINRNSGKY